MIFENYSYDFVVVFIIIVSIIVGIVNLFVMLEMRLQSHKIHLQHQRHITSQIRQF